MNAIMNPKKSVVALLVVVAVGAIGLSLSSEASHPPLAADDRPNILLIITDDQPLHLGFAMKKSRNWLRSGTTFKRAVITTPQCCPARATIVTGQYAHNHGVKELDLIGNLDQETTIQYELDEAGYETGFYGKFFNHWPISDAPPHFDDYAIAKNTRTAYKDGLWNVDGSIKVVEKYGSTFITDQAASFLDELEADRDDTPWMIQLSYPAPHSPNTPQRRFKKARVPAWKGSPAVFESDPSVDPGRRSDKPPWVRRSNRSFTSRKRVRSEQARSLMSVDLQLSILERKLEALDESGNTLVVFISDNGIEWGHHGISGKMVPYVESIRVPLYVIWPGRFRKAIDHRLVGNIDIAPTILEAAGISSTVERDGRSLLDRSWSRDRILIEGWARRAKSKHLVPPWAGLYGADLEYVEYYQQSQTKASYREYYDMRSDPFQLLNLLGDDDPSNDPYVGGLSSKLQEARRCSGADQCP